MPTRHRQAEARGERIARPLRFLTGLRDPADQVLLERLGAGLVQRDELAAELAVAMRRRVGESGRVSRAQLSAALAGGVEGLGFDLPVALSRFMEVVRATPEWVDWGLVDRGAAVFNRLGRNAGDVLLMLSLTGGYRFGGPPDLLVATGALTGESARRRLAETQHWVLGLMVPGELRPGGEAWRLTLHVRVMHAMVNASFEDSPGWDVARWGLPINQTDQAGTLGLFDATVIVASRALGVPISDDDSHALLHLWKYVGWLMGVHPDYLSDNERERNWLNLHILLAAADQTEAGRELARTIVRVQRERSYGIRNPCCPERVDSMNRSGCSACSRSSWGRPACMSWGCRCAFPGRMPVGWRPMSGATTSWVASGGRARLERRGRDAQLRDHATYLPDGGENGLAELPSRDLPR